MTHSSEGVGLALDFFWGEIFEFLEGVCTVDDVGVAFFLVEEEEEVRPIEGFVRVGFDEGDEGIDGKFEEVILPPILDLQGEGLSFYEGVFEGPEPFGHEIFEGGVWG